MNQVQEAIDWFNLNSELIHAKTKVNIETCEKLIEKIKDSNTILCPESALEEAEVIVEILFLVFAISENMDKIRLPEKHFHGSVHSTWGLFI